MRQPGRITEELSRMESHVIHIITIVLHFVAATVPFSF
jgi:hypothetical protein